MKFLISVADLKGTSIINQNVDEMFLNDAMETAQELYLAPLIGWKLYNRLLDGIIENESGETEIDLPDDYYNLVIDYIQPYLKRQIASNVCPVIDYKLKNAGVVQNTDEHVYHPSYKEMRSLQQHLEDEANAFADRLTKYLGWNNDKFPEYNQCCMKNTGYDTIIYLK